MTVKIRTILCSLTAGIQRIVFKINHHREQLCPAVFRPPTQGWPPPEVTLNQATRAAHTWNTNNCPLPFCLVLSHSWAQARPRLPIWSNSRSVCHLVSTVNQSPLRSTSRNMSRLTWPLVFRLMRESDRFTQLTTNQTPSSLFQLP